MENNIDFYTLLLNLKQINLKTEIIEKYCIEEKQINTISMIKNKIRQFLIQYNINKRTISMKTLTLTKQGLYFNIDQEIEYILSRYNISKKEKSIESIEELDEVIKKLQNIKKRNQLKNQFPQLFEEYLKDENKFRAKNHIPEDKKVPPIIVKRFNKKEIEKICYLKRKLKINFSDITNIGKYLNDSQMNRLKLIIAYQMMNLYEKEQYKNNIIKYLEDFLIINKKLLEEDYCFKIKEENQYGLELYKTFSIKEVEKFITKITKKETQPSNSKRINMNFLEVTKDKHHEILGKYYKLGLLCKTDEEKKELLKRKLEFFQSLNASKIEIGINSFEGYIGIKTEDNIIILDKLFDNIKEGKIATNQAIYIMTEEEFTNMMQLSKIECIKQMKEGLIRANRVLHIGRWEERIQKKKKELKLT